MLNVIQRVRDLICDIQDNAHGRKIDASYEWRSHMAIHSDHVQRERARADFFALVSSK